MKPEREGIIRRDVNYTTEDRFRREQLHLAAFHDLQSRQYSGVKFDLIKKSPDWRKTGKREIHVQARKIADCFRRNFENEFLIELTRERCFGGFGRLHPAAETHPV